MGCCGATVKCIRFSAFNSLLGGVLMVAAAFGLFGTMGTIFDNILCITNGFNTLASLGGEYSQDAQLIPQDAIDAIRAWIDLLRVLSILPAIVCCAFLLMSCILGCIDSKSYCCAKFFNVLGIIASIIGIAFYCICGIAATLVDTPQAQAQLAQFTSSCDNELPQLQAELANATATYNAAVAAGVDTTAAKAELDTATQGLDAFSSVCDCYKAIFGLLGDMTLPGFLGMAASVYALIAVSVLCCNQGCCKQPAGGGIKPVA